MIRILVHGIKDGQHEIDLKVPAKEQDGIVPEFFGDVLVKGKLTKLVNRFSFRGLAKCKALLVCDRTLKEFEQEIETELLLSFIADNNLVFGIDPDAEEIKDNEERVIREDEKYVDITRDVVESLMLGIPMKKVAPDAVDKDLEELYPNLSPENEDDEIDDRWDALKKIKLN